MGVVGALRTLWRLRLVVLVIAVVAAALGGMVAYRFSPPSTLESRRYHISVGTATALVDSPSSQIVDLGGQDTLGIDIGSLAGRATLLASLMTTSPLKEEIAQKSGANPEKLIAISPALAAPAPGTKSAAPDTSNPESLVLKATVPTLESGQVPMIVVTTQAPEPEQAAKLANAAMQVLEKHLQSVAASDNVPADRRVTVRQLGTAGATVETRGPGKLMAVIATIFLFGFGCGAVLLLVALAGGWRAATELERNPAPRGPAEPQVNGHANHPVPAPTPARPRPGVPPKLAPRPTAARFDEPPGDASAPRNWASR
jgi:hypothetical protein